MGLKTGDTKGKSPGRLVRIACCLLFAWLLFVPAYNAWRSPKNVFEEAFWGCVDKSCTNAMLCEGGVWYPGDYLLAFLNPLREDSMNGVDMKRNPLYRSLWKRLSGDPVNDLDLDIDDRFDEYYGRWIVSTDIQRKIDSDTIAYVSSVNVQTMGMSRITSENKLFISFELTSQADPSSQGENSIGYANFTIHIGSGEIETFIIWLYNSSPDLESLEQAAKDILIDDLTGEYFKLNEESAFGVDNLGDWKWGESKTARAPR